MRVLGVDWGSKRIGIAVGDAESGVFSPRPALTASGALKRDAEGISTKAAEEEAEAIVVGLPIATEGEERMERICRHLASHLQDLGLKVFTVDEALTSVTAHRDLRDAGLKASQRRRHIDGEAAVRILERWASGA